jgi:hypothetical protein
VSRRAFARAGLRSGESTFGERMIPASVAASESVM